MHYFCTYFDQNYLTRGLALHRSLVDHAGDFELVVLCMDEAVEKALRAKALPRVRLLPVAELTQHYPALAAARADRAKLEFYFTCTSWLMRHLLPQLPAGELLTYLDADLYFFSPPGPVYAEIGRASVAITPHRFPASLAHLERYGRYNVGWVSLRHDATGQACAADWATKCAGWCFNRLEAERYADQKYLDAWTSNFPGTVSLMHPGVNAAPWNIKDCTLTAGPQGVHLNGQPLIFYHFHALVHLGRRLYDPSLHKYDAVLSPGLREHVYRPYLGLLQDAPDAGGDTPELLPLPRADDPRGGLAVDYLIGLLQASELDRAIRLLAVQEAQAATKQTVDYLRVVERDRDQARADQEQTIGFLKAVEKDSADRLVSIQFHQDKLKAAYAEQEQTIAFLRTVEKDSADRLASIQFYQDKLKAAYADLERNVAYLKTLEAEIAAHLKVGADKDAVIARLNAQLRAATARPPAAS